MELILYPHPPLPDSLPFEVVERKGKGHPDTLADGIVETISRNLCKAYLDRFGRILHHNVDKGQLTAGRTSVKFGGGEFLKPVRVYLSGRATRWLREGATWVEVPVEVIARRSVAEYFRRETRFPPETEIESAITQGAPELMRLAGEKPGANDTSIGVGFYPLTPLEKAVFDLEKYLNSSELKARMPWVGEDVKVLGIRKGEVHSFTIAAAFVSRFVFGPEDYLEKKQRLKEEILTFLEKRLEGSVSVQLNSADSKGSFYLTLTGLSVEMGDDGAVGRGNRANGLITPMRPMTLEATAGKNPLNHVGKIYSVLAHRAARRIYEETSSPATVFLVSKIGAPLEEPQMVGIWCQEEKAREIVKEEVQAVSEMTMAFVEGELQLF